MADADFTAGAAATTSHRAATQTEMRIVTARGGSRVFSNIDEVRNFSKATADDLAALTLIMTESNADYGFVEQMWGLANDLAFQLQQSIGLVCEAESSNRLSVA
ncbi:hypothetical protein [Burkholderia cenocepacia]|uniref:hypothetical protein n=1 Tax=Burkholderia cenocepacia TaxID=95486 RepID=UPI00055126C6|nr:hypothetical protein [Burkholderia cenocepacia]